MKTKPAPLDISILAPTGGADTTPGGAAPPRAPVAPAPATAAPAPAAPAEKLVHLTVQMTKEERKAVHRFADEYDSTAREIVHLGVAALQHLIQTHGDLAKVRTILKR